MANVFQIKRSSVQGRKPQDSDLEIGELAVNLYDGLLYSKNTTGNVIVVGSSTTSNVTEGVNLYFTNTRAVSAFTPGNNIAIAANGLISATVVSSPTIDATITGTETEIFRFDKTTYRAGKALITVSDSPNFKVEELLVIHDGTNVALNRPYVSSYFEQTYALGVYNEILNNDIDATVGSISVEYTANIVGDDVIVYGTASTGTPSVKGTINYVSV